MILAAVAELGRTFSIEACCDWDSISLGEEEDQDFSGVATADLREDGTLTAINETQTGIHPGERYLRPR